MPSHVGLSGNDAADRAANAAIHSRDEVDVVFTLEENGCIVKKH